MKKSSKILCALVAGLFLPNLLIKSSEPVLAYVDDYVNEDGVTQYGYYLVANEVNQKVWEFDEETGEVSYCYAGDGDISAQRVYNYAIRNLEIEGTDSYSVSATFVPDPDSDLSAERAYGIVCWYQDADNYLIYWMQQKTSGDWSGQFYGRVDGSLRHMWMPKKYEGGSITYSDYWLRGEYYDLWWDQSVYTHPDLLSQRNILLTTTVGLKVVSSLEEVTVAGETLTCRKFELHQIVNNEDKLSCEFYVKQIKADSGSFYTGVYSEMFNVGIENFTISCENTDFTKPVVEAINALPESMDNITQIADITKARTMYNGLLSYKSQVAEDVVSKLENTEDSVGTYVDNAILALDDTKSSFVDDVDATLNLYESLSVELQEKVSKTDELLAAIEKAKTWQDPTKQSDSVVEDSSSEEQTSSVEEKTSSVEEKSDVTSVESTDTSVATSVKESSEEKTSENVTPESKKGCKGSATGSIAGLLFMAMLTLKKRKDK